MWYGDWLERCHGNLACLKIRSQLTDKKLAYLNTIFAGSQTKLFLYRLIKELACQSPQSFRSNLTSSKRYAQIKPTREGRIIGIKTLHIFWHVEMMIFEHRCNCRLVICISYHGNGHRTNWSPIRSVIIRVITNSNNRAAGA